MMRTIVLFCLICVVFSIPTHHVLHLQNQIKDVFMIETPEDFSFQVLGFSWDSCGTSSDILNLTKLSVGPDPVSVPGNVTVTAFASISTDVGSPIKASVKVYKKIGIWVELPCFSGLGSCDYADGCSLISSLNLPYCPFDTCTCPFPSGTYDLSKGISIPIQLPASIPSWAGSGDYKAHVQLTNSTGVEIGCIEVILSVKIVPSMEQDLEELTTKSKRWKFTHGIDHPINPLNNTSCDPNNFEYILCNLTSSNPNNDCPSGQVCHKVGCPIPGMCWWPSNCTCDPETKEMNCQSSPSHEGECNSKYCGICQPRGDNEVGESKIYTFLGAENVPVHLAYINAPWRYDALRLENPKYYNDYIERQKLAGQ